MRMSSNMRPGRRRTGTRAAPEHKQQAWAHPEGRDSACGSQLKPVPPLFRQEGRRWIVGVIAPLTGMATAPHICPRGPKVKRGVKPIQGCPSQSWCLSFTKSPEGKVFRHVLKREPEFCPSFAPGLRLAGGWPVYQWASGVPPQVCKPGLIQLPVQPPFPSCSASRGQRINKDHPHSAQSDSPCD